MRLALLTIALLSVGCSTHQNLCSIENVPESGWALVGRSIDSGLLDLRGANDRVDVALDYFRAAPRLDLFINPAGQLLLCRPAPDIVRCGESAIGVRQTSSGTYVLDDSTVGWIITC